MPRSLLKRLPRPIEERCRAIVLLVKYRFRKRPGHRPTPIIGQLCDLPLWATPNFYWLSGIPRPTWLPIYSAPGRRHGTAVTRGWPVEGVDRILVIGFTHGRGGLDDGLTRSERVVGPSLRLDKSPIWCLVQIPRSHLEPGFQPPPSSPPDAYIGFVPAIWLEKVDPPK